MKSFRFVIVIIAILVLSACGTLAKPTSAPLRIAVNLWPGLYPAAIAQGLSYCQAFYPISLSDMAQGFPSWLA